jgi:hypothetical protein
MPFTGAGMRQHVHSGNHAAESFVSFIPLFDSVVTPPHNFVASRRHALASLAAARSYARFTQALYSPDHAGRGTARRSAVRPAWLRRLKKTGCCMASEMMHRAGAHTGMVVRSRSGPLSNCGTLAPVSSLSDRSVMPAERNAAAQPVRLQLNSRAVSTPGAAAASSFHSTAGVEHRG